MLSFNSVSWSISKPISTDSSQLSFHSSLNPLRNRDPQSFSKLDLPRFSIQSKLRKLRERIETVKNTQKVTEAMKLVAAAKVRKAQEAVVGGRPFTETLSQVLHDINEQCQLDDVEIPLTAVRPVKKVALVVVTGDRGLCGGFNNAVLKRATLRIEELSNLGVDHTLISVGKKGNSHFSRRADVNVDKYVEGENFPTSKEAQVIADDVFSLFLCEEVDKVEIIYTKFVSLVKSKPIVRNLLPLGEARDVHGRTIDLSDEEVFRLSTKKGKLTVERDPITAGKEAKGKLLPNYEFEQDPAQILDALLPLYLNSQILRALQESYASELAARMNAMSSATENAVELKRSLQIEYNRERQAKITGEILEIVAGADALL